MARWITLGSNVVTALAVLGVMSVAVGAPATLVNVQNGSTVVSTSNPFPVDCVTGCSSSGGAQDVNLVKVGGAAVALGQTTMSASIPVVLPSNQSSIPVAATLQAGSAIAGKVGIDQTTPGTTNGVQINAALPAGANIIGALTANQSVNESQINGVTPLMGNGVTGTGAQRVTIASDNTAFSVNATLSAETTKVIGTVNQGTSPWVVSGAGGTFPITGATSNASSGVATSSTNVPAVGYSYLFNGTTWDQSKSGDVNNATGVTGVQDIIPVARYNATLPTLTDTRYNSLQVGQRGALQVQVMNADGTTGWAFAAPADGQSLAASSAPVRGIMGVYNGATTDLTREIVNATNSTGTGILAAGILAQFDDVAPTAISENQFGNVRMSANRNQYTTIRDAAGNERGVNVTAASTSAALADPALVVSLSPNPDNVCTGKTPINQTTSTDVKTFTNIGYICSIILVSATAQNISVIEGTGTVCATGTSAVIGGTTASMAVGVNGGFSAVSDRPWVQLGASADHLCILQSASGNVSGIITWQDHT